MKIAIVGTGYVGLVAGVCFADAGHEVICVDTNAARVETLRDGRVPFYEPGLEDLFRLNAKRLRFTTDIASAVNEAELLFTAVGTPEQADGSADLGPTFAVLDSIAQHAREKKYVVLKSTVPIGTAARAKGFMREHARVPIEIVSNPEFLRQGAAVEDFLKPDRVVIGCESDDARRLMGDLYGSFLRGGRPLFMDNTSAEMVKYAANAFLAVKISYINELALLADKLGADIESVRAGFTSDARINPSFFHPGIGYGGSCFPKDVRALYHTGKEQDLDLKILRAADEVNERQKTVLSQRLIERVGSLKGKTIAIWGLAFKARTDDVRRAPSLAIMEDLFLNGARIRAYDPVAGQNAERASRVPFEACADMMSAARGADALLIVTEWPEFQAVDFAKLRQEMNTPLILDGRNLFDPRKPAKAGFEYYGIGRLARGEKPSARLVKEKPVSRPRVTRLETVQIAEA